MPPHFEETRSPSQTRSLMIYARNVCARNYISCIDSERADVSIGDSIVKDKPSSLVL